jgi:hypothetical protein
MFTHHRITTLAGTVIAGAALGLAAVATAGSAAAGSTDDDFLAQLKTQGIGYDSPQGAIQDGHVVCQDLANGRSVNSIGQEILSNTDLTTKQAAFVIVAAVHSYCPQYQSNLSA